MCTFDSRLTGESGPSTKSEDTLQSSQCVWNILALVRLHLPLLRLTSRRRAPGEGRGSPVSVRADHQLDGVPGQSLLPGGCSSFCARLFVVEQRLLC